MFTLKFLKVKEAFSNGNIHTAVKKTTKNIHSAGKYKSNLASLDNLHRISHIVFLNQIQMWPKKVLFFFGGGGHITF